MRHGFPPEHAESPPASCPRCEHQSITNLPGNPKSRQFWRRCDACAHVWPHPERRRQTRDRRTDTRKERRRPWPEGL